MLAAGFSLLAAAGRHLVNDQHLFTQPRLLWHAVGLVFVEDGGEVDDLLPYAVVELNRDLLVAAAGVGLVLLALGIGLRQRLARGRPGRIRIVRASLGVWGAGETLAVALVRGLLLLFGYLLCAELVAGETLSWELADRTVSRGVAVIVLLARLVAAGYPRL